MGGRDYTDSSYTKTFLKIMQGERKLPKEDRALYSDFIDAVLRALSKGEDHKVEQAMAILKGEV